MMFPGADGSGLATGPLAAWEAEYARVKAQAFSTVTILSTGNEGATASGQVNFPAKVLLEALILRRAELDTTFAAAVPRRSMGHILRVT